MRLVLLSVLILLILPSSLVIAQIKPVITYTYYPVKPAAGQSVYKQIFEDSIISHKGRKVAAITDWNIKYNVEYTQLGEGLCKVEKHDVAPTCDITLPQLVSDEIRLNKVFDEYMPYLRRHELHHCQIATDYANYLDDKLRSLGTMKCQALKTAVKAVRNEAISEAKRAHRLFDQQTLENRKNFHAGKHFLGDLYPENP